MKKEIAKKWIKALRSGKYTQGKNYLLHFNKKGEPKHCCLGVLCELYNDSMKKNHKKSLTIENITDLDDTFFVCFDGQGEGLPKVVQEWAGMSDSTGHFNDDKNREHCLADYNDTGKKFDTISDIIEKNVENL